MFDSMVHRMPLMVELKSALMETGEQFVMITGITEMQVFFADNLDLLHMVNYCVQLLIAVANLSPSIKFSFKFYH